MQNRREINNLLRCLFLFSIPYRSANRTSLNGFRLPWQPVVFNGIAVSIKMSRSNCCCYGKRLRAQREPSMKQALLGLRMYWFEHVWVHITTFHLFLLKQRTSSVHQDSSPHMSEQCLGAMQLALLNQNMPLSGTTVASGPAWYCFIGIAVGCFTTLALWLYLVLIWLP